MQSQQNQQVTNEKRGKQVQPWIICFSYSLGVLSDNHEREDIEASVYKGAQHHEKT